MCGRFSVNKDAQELEAFIGGALPQEFARKEVFPSQPVLAVTDQGITTLNWGLRVEWQSRPIINARSESISQKKTFAKAFQQHRCLVPADGYWEWSTDKRRYYFHFADNRLFWLGGIYYPGKAASELVLITTEPNSVAAPIHDRMPVIIDPEQKDEWLHGHDMAHLDMMVQPRELAGLEVEQSRKISAHV